MFQHWIWISIKELVLSSQIVSNSGIHSGFFPPVIRIFKNQNSCLAASCSFKFSKPLFVMKVDLASGGYVYSHKKIITERTNNRQSVRLFPQVFLPLYLLASINARAKCSLASLHFSSVPSLLFP